LVLLQFSPQIEEMDQFAKTIIQREAPRSLSA